MTNFRRLAKALHRVVVVCTLLFGALAGLVAYGRRPLVPYTGAARSLLQPAH